MSELKIRDAQLEDAARLVEIYSHYVLNTAVSFEYAVPSLDEFKDIINNHPGFVKAMWCGSNECEEKIKEIVTLSLR